MRTLLSILFLLPVLIGFGQKNNQTAKKLKKDRVGVYVSGVISSLDGLEGSENRKLYTDYLKEFKAAGFTTKGGVLPRYGFSISAYYSRMFSKRFAFNLDVGYIQNGYKEQLFVEGSDSSTTIKRDYSLKVDLNYLHLFSGVKYYHDSGMFLTLGFYMNYNIYDKVKYSDSFYLKNRAGEDAYNKSSDQYFHEYYKEDRQIFLMGLGFSVGYMFQKFEVEASLKNSSNIAASDEDLDMRFIITQLGVRYRFNKITNE